MTSQAALRLEPIAVHHQSAASSELPEGRLAAIDWPAFETVLTRDGYAVLPSLLTSNQCRSVAGLFPHDEQFRSPKRPGRAEVVPLRQGDAVVFAVNHRPVRSTRGFYRANLRHGVSKLHRGERHTLGIIFHDAK